MDPKTYQPKCSVVLKKNIGRTSLGGGQAASERFRGAKREIDLTPHLGRGGVVVVDKSTRQTTGMFSVTLVDRFDADLQDSLYGLFEPMDVIEIRMARDTSLYAGDYPNSMPIMMRGFVSDIRRKKTMTTEGPQRSVVISGHDYGKILQLMRIVYLPGMVLGETLLSSLRLAIQYGVGSEPFADGAEFIQKIMSEVINGDFLAKMRASSLAGIKDANPGATSPISDIGVIATAGGGSIYPFGANEWPGGTIDDLLRLFGDVGPWNEMFIEDREEGTWGPAAPYLIYRPTPFKDVDGKVIQPADQADNVVPVFDSDVTDFEVGRSDSGVANYYWAEAPRYNMIDGAALKFGALHDQYPPNPFVSDYQNCDPTLYGIRLMEATTQQGMRIDGLPADALQSGLGDGLSMMAAKRRVLIENNKDNVVFEDGTLNIMGTESLRAGCWIELSQGGGGIHSLYYAHQVRHQYTFGGSYVTFATVDRGTGFIDRVKRAGGAASPYFSEMTLRGTGRI